MSERTRKTMQELARDALACQDACNMLGLSRSFGLEVIPDLKAALEAEGVHGNGLVADHPVTKLWVSKLHSLAGMGISDLDRFHAAYEACEHLAAGQPMKPLVAGACLGDNLPSDAVLEVLATDPRELGKP